MVQLPEVRAACVFLKAIATLSTRRTFCCSILRQKHLPSPSLKLFGTEIICVRNQGGSPFNAISCNSNNLRGTIFLPLNMPEIGVCLSNNGFLGWMQCGIV